MFASVSVLCPQSANRMVFVLVMNYTGHSGTVNCTENSGEEVFTHLFQATISVVISFPNRMKCMRNVGSKSELALQSSSNRPCTENRSFLSYFFS